MPAAIAIDRHIRWNAKEFMTYFNKIVTNLSRNLLSRKTPAAYFPAPWAPFKAGRMHGDDSLPAAPKRILIVEDNELNMKLLHDVLEAHGYATIATREGAVALALAREHRPDLILMDLQLPDVSGFDAVRQLKSHAETKAIPVVAVTAFALLGDEHKALTSGCDGYIAKPIALRDFLDMVERFIGAADGSR